MIDWLTVSLNALWILGLAILLADLSYHHWLAGRTARRFRDVLSLPSWKIPFSAGLLLICVGLGYGLAGRWWETVVWSALAFTSASQFVADVRQAVRTKRSS